MAFVGRYGRKEPPINTEGKIRVKNKTDEIGGVEAEKTVSGGVWSTTTCYYRADEVGG